MPQSISLMLDCSRNAVANIEFLKRFIDILQKCGYNQLQLYTEDTYKVDGEPFFGYFRGAYGKDELKELDDYAFNRGIELVPAIQTLGHLATIFNWGEYFKIHDTADCLLAGAEETYVFIEKLIAYISTVFRSKKINIGMDESFWSGKGEYLKRFGYKNPDDIYIEHLNRVAEILKKYDREPMMWGDMFYRNSNNGNYYSKNPIVSEASKKLIPENVSIIYWDYYNKDKDLIKAMAESANKLKPGAWFAGGAWSWIGFMPRNDFAISQSIAAIPTVKEAGIENFILTLWGDNGAECSKIACLPSIYYFAQLAKGETDENKIREGFSNIFGREIDELISLKELNDLEGNKDKITNVCKYMLFNDPLIGIYDNSVDASKKVLFTKAKEKYLAYAKDSPFSYVFETAASLASVMEIKYDLGVRIRKAYSKKNNGELNIISNEIDVLISRVEKFYSCFKEQWYFENKLEGFEIQTNRIGGLILRLKEVKELLLDYISGDIKEIKPLEQPILPFEGCEVGDDLCVNNYSICASVNVH